MITSVIRNLPAFVSMEGCSFQLVINVQDDQSATLAYILTGVGDKSPHLAGFKINGKWFNPLTKKFTNTLFTYPGIQSEMSLRMAISKTRQFIDVHLPAFKVPMLSGRRRIA